MIIVKIVFWIYLLGVIISTSNLGSRHPRIVSYDLGADVVSFVLNAFVAIGLYFFIWY